LQRCALHGMTADGQRFHERQLFEGKLVAYMQFSGREQELWPQTPVAMNAQDLQFLTAIWPAPAAGVAIRIVYVWLDRTAFARLYVGHIRADGDYFHAEFMAGNARVTEKRHLAQVPAYIGAANAHAVYAHQCLAWAGLAGSFDFNLPNLFRGDKRKSLHFLSRQSYERAKAC
jgi:hypothetical protein